MAESGEPGSLSLSLSKGSDAIVDICCDICVEDGRQVEAEGYCVDCSDFLCCECFRAHRRTKMSRNHTLQDAATMPREKALSEATGSDSIKDECTEPCEHHPGRISEYYCQDHKQLGCSACMTAKHRKCDNVDLISNLTQGFLESQAFKRTEKDLEDLKSRCVQVITDSEGNMANIDTGSANTIQEVLDLQRDMHNVFESFLEDVKRKANAIKSEGLQKMTTSVNIGQEVYKTTERIGTEMDSLKTNGNLCQLYVKILGMPEKLRMLNHKLEGVESANVISFSPSAEIQSLRDGSIPVGVCTAKPSVNSDPKHITAKHVYDINIKTYNDSRTCYISGITTVSDDKLIIADMFNEKVKLVDTKSAKVISELKLPTGPWDVAVVSPTSAAVTLPKNKQILIVEIDDEIRSQCTVEARGECRGIAFTDNKLIVTLAGPSESVAIIHAHGVIEKQISVKTARWLSHIAVEPQKKSLLVSDPMGGLIVSLTLSNDTQQVVYKSSNLRGPRGIAIGPSKTILVAGSSNGRIILLSKEGTYIKDLVDRVGCPCGISYCQNTNKLYVGFESIANTKDDVSDIVRVYQLS